MTEIEQLRAELQELQAATTRMFAVLAAVMPQIPGAAHSAIALHNNLHRDHHKDMPEKFHDMAVGVMLAASSSALKTNPDDNQLQDLYTGLRPGSRH